MRLRVRARAVLAGVAASAALLSASAADGRGLVAGRALFPYLQRLTMPPAASCPSGTPVQPFTLINNARLSPLAVARFENAMVAQSLQVRAAWGTPCVQFAAAGWYLYLEPSVSGYGAHFAPGDTEGSPLFPNAICIRRPDPSQVCTETSVDSDWTVNASHEVVEALVDPSNQGLEVCDPVEQWPYRVRGVWMSDFVRRDGRAFR